MPDRKVLVPGPDHPITIEPNPNRIVVTAGGRTIADTTEALTLRESTYPPVAYIPRKDVDFSVLERTDHQTYCPYKGESAYYSITGGAENAIWTYDAPYDAVAQIKGHVAVYPDRVDKIEETPR